MTENYHPRLRPVTAKMLIDKISLNLNATMNYKAKNHTYQHILLDIMQQLANYIVGRRKDLQLAIPIVKIHRSDPLEVRQRILSMSPVGRKT